MNHNAIRPGYETFGNAIPETVNRRTSATTRPAASGVGRCRCRPLPWSCATTSTTSRRRRWRCSRRVAGQAKEYLRRFHRTGWKSWRKGSRRAVRVRHSAGQGDRRGWPSSSTSCARSTSRSASRRCAGGGGGPLRRRAATSSASTSLPQLRRRPADPAGLSGRRASLLTTTCSWSCCPSLRREGRAGGRARVRSAAVAPVAGGGAVGARVRRRSVVLLAERGQEAFARRAPAAEARFRSRWRRRSFRRRRRGILRPGPGSCRPGRACGCGSRDRVRAAAYDFASAAAAPVRPTPRRAAGPDRHLRAVGGTDSIGWIRYVLLDGERVP